MSPSADLIPAEAVTLMNGQPRTNSLILAKIFGKRHDNILRSIESLDVPKEFIALNFEGNSYFDSIGRQLPMISMTRDGFTLLAFGFTGAKAMQFKMAYIQRFNQLEAAAPRPSAPAAATPRQLAVPDTLTKQQLYDLRDVIRSTFLAPFNEGKTVLGNQISRKFGVRRLASLTQSQFETACSFASSIRVTYTLHLPDGQTITPLTSTIPGGEAESGKAV